MSIDIRDQRVRRLLSTIGTPYYWGAGNLTTPFSEILKGADCSGHAQVCGREIGVIRPDAWYDITSLGLANACLPIEPKDAVLGDFVFYGTGRGDRPITHVMTFLGDGMVIGASGGGSSTKGNDPRACVQVRPLSYRHDVVVVGRLKPGFRP